jgi:hypothetical protein
MGAGMSGNGYADGAISIRFSLEAPIVNSDALVLSMASWRWIWVE